MTNYLSETTEFEKPIHSGNFQRAQPRNSTSSGNGDGEGDQAMDQSPGNVRFSIIAKWGQTGDYGNNFKVQNRKLPDYSWPSADFEPSIEEWTKLRANDELDQPAVESVNQEARVNTLLSNFFFGYSGYSK